jgi:CheY-like chemotaxis protein
MPKLVLIIEDHEDSCKTLEAILVSANFACECVESRNEAVRLLNSGLVPACILTDYLMPGMSMTEFLDKTKALGIRIVLVTALTSVDSIAKRFGLRYFVRKPVVPDELIRMVKLAVESGEHAAIAPPPHK